MRAATPGLPWRQFDRYWKFIKGVASQWYVHVALLVIVASAMLLMNLGAGPVSGNDEIIYSGVSQNMVQLSTTMQRKVCGGFCPIAIVLRSIGCVMR